MSYWDERDDDAELFRKRKDAVTSTWAIVGEELGVEATVAFYNRLFDLHPEVKPMFANYSEEGYDIYEQAEKLFNSLCVAVEFLNDVESLIPILRDLGKKVMRARSNYTRFITLRFSSLSFVPARGEMECATFTLRGCWWMPHMDTEN